MNKPALSSRYAVAPAGPGQPAQLAFRSQDSEWPGYYPIAGVGSPCGLRALPMLLLAAPLTRLPDSPTS